MKRYDTQGQAIQAVFSTHTDALGGIGLMPDKREWTRPESTAAKAQLGVGKRTCQCAECERFFTGIAPFDRHMGGTPADRHCMTDSQMLRLGMTANEHGVWSYGTGGKKEDVA